MKNATSAWCVLFQECLFYLGGILASRPSGAASSFDGSHFPLSIPIIRDEAVGSQSAVGSE